MPYMNRNQAQALLGAWQTIVGAENAGWPTPLHHGMAGGHRGRRFRPNFGGYGGPQTMFGYGPYGYPLPAPPAPPVAYDYGPIPPRHVLVEFETVQLAMDFVIVTTFVGTSEAGEQFVCTVLGTAAV